MSGEAIAIVLVIVIFAAAAFDNWRWQEKMEEGKRNMSVYHKLPADIFGLRDTRLKEFIQSMDSHESKVYTYTGTLPDGRLVTVSVGLEEAAETLARAVRGNMTISHNYPAE